MTRHPISHRLGAAVAAPKSRPGGSSGRLHLVFFAVLSLTLMGLYARALWIGPYGDDLLRIAHAAVYGFDLQYPFYKFRPIERLLTALNYSVLGLRTSLAVASSVLGLCLSSISVWYVAHFLRPRSVAYPYAASVFFALHSVNVSAVFQIDTVSQQYATVFSLFALYWYLSRSERSVAVYHGAGTGLLLLMLLSKEATAGVAVVLPVAVIASPKLVPWAQLRGPATRPSARTRWLDGRTRGVPRPVADRWRPRARRPLDWTWVWRWPR